MSKDKTFNISLLGESGVGKTTLFYFHKDQKFQDILSTIGIVEFIQKKQFQDDNKMYKFKIFDTAGQERYRSIANTTIQIADGFLMVFAVNNRNSFERITYWIEYIDQHVNLKEKILYLVGNKIDLEEREVQKEEGEEFAKKMGIQYKETSARTGKGIEEVFQGIYLDIYEKFKKSKNNNIKDGKEINEDKRIKLDEKHHIQKGKNKFLNFLEKLC